MPKKRVRHLRVLLLKKGISDSDALKDLAKLNKFSVSTKTPFAASLYVENSSIRVPSWVSFVQPAIKTQLRELMNSTTSAVLIIDVAKRRFAFTFGFGRNLLNQDCFERDFGLKVALNTSDPENLRSVDVRTFEELTLHTRRQASRGSSLDTFGLNVTQDLMRSVTGKPIDSALARIMAGSDGLAFAAAMDFEELGDKCDALLKAYRSKEYKKRFEFIDFLRSERDPKVVADLNTQLVAQLNKGDLTGIHCGPPEPIEWENIDGFTFGAGKSAPDFPEIDVEEWLKSRNPNESVTLESLKATRVGLRQSGIETPHLKWNLFSCIVFENQIGNKLYVLTGGDWFQIASKFVDRVDARVKAIVANAPTFPQAKRNEMEGAYNARAAKEKNYILMDRKFSRIDGSSIEFCDLLTPDKAIVHVKPYKGSATLSHLFSQAVISADSFVDDGDFRKQAKAHVQSADSKLAGLIPDSRPQNDQYSIVYAIIAKDGGTWPLSLPFFSRLNLMNAADHLLRRNFSVALVRVDRA